jgi:hypothetical protein
MLLLLQNSYRLQLLLHLLHWLVLMCTQSSL